MYAPAAMYFDLIGWIHHFSFRLNLLVFVSNNRYSCSYLRLCLDYLILLTLNHTLKYIFPLLVAIRVVLRAFRETCDTFLIHFVKVVINLLVYTLHGMY